MIEKEFDALIRLLDDEDVEVYNHIENRLLSYGKNAVPLLEGAWELSFNGILQNRIENIIHKINYDAFIHDLTQWKNRKEHDHHTLLAGAILIAKYQYPDFSEEKLMGQLKQIIKDIWLELNDNLTALEKINILNHFFFNVYGFSGNTGNYHAPQNSYVNIAMESRKGNPLMLSLIYSYIAQSLEIPVYGVNLPEHFVLAYKDSASYGNDNKVFFYINAFSKGTVFGKKEIDNFIKQLGLKAEPSFYEPCDNVDILKRMLRNLIYAYKKENDGDKARELKAALKALEA